MGRLDLYAKEIFAAETPTVTHGGAAFQLPAALNLPRFASMAAC